MKLKFIFLLLLIHCFVSVIGQNDQIYIYHQTVEGESFKSLEKIYGVQENEIRAANPNLQNTLKSGESVRIPYSKSLVSNTPQTVVKNVSPTDSQYYEVGAKETLWGISHKFNISMDALIAANPILKDGLKIGQKILIPNEKWIVKADIIPDTQPQSINNSSFHIVKAGETMYSIAKNHRVRLDSLQFANPQIINNQLSVGDTLQIPVYVNKNDYIEHTTIEKEKIAEIAFNYQTPVQEIKEVNPEFSKTVAAGEVVKIPVAPFQESDTSSTVQHQNVTPEESNPEPEESTSLCIGGWNTESVFKIALMMPLHSKEINILPENKATTKTDITNDPFFQFFQFYQSALLALEELKNNDLHLELYVYDVSDNTTSIDQIIQNETLPQMDIIIGILYKEQFAKVSNFAREHNITLINVNSKRDDIVQGFPNTIKMMPIFSNYSKSAVSVLPDTVGSFKLIMVRKKDSIFAKADAQIREALADRYSNTLYVDSTLFSNYDVIKNLSTTKPNYVIVMNKNTASVMDLLRLLDKKKKEYEIHIIGYLDWDEMTSLDVHHLQHLHTVFTSSYLVDYKDDDVMRFVRNFRDRYDSEPNRWAFQGYDIISYFVEGLAKFGKDFMNCCDHIEYQPMTTKYRFENSAGNGYINQFWNIYTIENFEIMKWY